jgi:hypothetical protein
MSRSPLDLKPEMTPPDNPAGAYIADPNPSVERRAELIGEVERLPSHLRGLVAGLTAVQLDTKYKNWTVRQIVHHLADSHLNAYVRMKLALTEDQPTIKPYNETKWSQLPDAVGMEAEVSLRLLDGLHARWTAAWRAMTSADFERGYFHPEYGRTIRLAEALGMYAWHCRHHGEMIAWLRKQHGWET